MWKLCTEDLEMPRGDQGPQRAEHVLHGAPPAAPEANSTGGCRESAGERQVSWLVLTPSLITAVTSVWDERRGKGWLCSGSRATGHPGRRAASPDGACRGFSGLEVVDLDGGDAKPGRVLPTGTIHRAVASASNAARHPAGSGRGWARPRPCLHERPPGSEPRQQACSIALW